MNQDNCGDAKADGDNRGQQQADVLGLQVGGQATDCQENGNPSKDVDDERHDSDLAAPSLEGGRFSFLFRFCEVADLLFQQIALFLKFRYLLLERSVLRLKLDNLAERNRQLEMRLLGLRRWHVQYPPDDDRTNDGAAAVVKPNVRGNRATAARRLGRAAQHKPRRCAAQVPCCWRSS